MHRLIPLESFECSDLPVLAVETTGVIRYANRAAAELFAPDPDQIVGRHCWEHARLQTPDGEEFCGSRCPILQGGCRGPVQALHQVVLPATGSVVAPLRFDLVTFVVPPAPCLNCTILHFFIPELDASERPATPDETRSLLKNSRLHLLTARELEVLELLARGLDPADVAGRLDVSLATVRNHIHSTLQKLRLHRQVDAILLLMDKHSRSSATIKK